MAKIKLYCGFCLHKDTYEKIQANSKKSNLSQRITCNNCGKNLNHKNVVKDVN